MPKVLKPASSSLAVAISILVTTVAACDRHEKPAGAQTASETPLSVDIEISAPMSNDHEIYSATRANDRSWQVAVTCYAPSYTSESLGAKSQSSGKLGPVASERLDAIFADPKTWSEPTDPPPACVDGANTTVQIRSTRRSRTTRHTCNVSGLSGEVAYLVTKLPCPTEAEKQAH
jgi:hypothetical protein